MWTRPYIITLSVDLPEDQHYHSTGAMNREKLLHSTVRKCNHWAPLTFSTFHWGPTYSLPEGFDLRPSHCRLFSNPSAHLLLITFSCSTSLRHYLTGPDSSVRMNQSTCPGGFNTQTDWGASVKRKTPTWESVNRCYLPATCLGIKQTESSLWSWIINSLSYQLLPATDPADQQRVINRKLNHWVQFLVSLVQ